jgi:hypothetical protein
MVVYGIIEYFYKRMLILNENETDRQVVVIMDEWKHANFLCRNYIFNGLDNTFYNMYSPIQTAKELWDSLELGLRYVVYFYGVEYILMGLLLTAL